MQFIQISTTTSYVVIQNAEDLTIKNTFISAQGSDSSLGRHTIGCISDWGSSSSASLLSDEPESCTSYGPSKGSHLHAAGTCRPCVFMTRKGGCANGSDCDYCHEHHSKQYIKKKQKLNKVKSRTKKHRNQKWAEGCFVDTTAQ